MKHKILAKIVLVLLTPTMLISCSPKSQQTVVAVSDNTTIPKAQQAAVTVNANTTSTPKIEDKKIEKPSLNTDTVVTTNKKPFTPTVISQISGLSTQKIEWSWLYSPKTNAALLSKYHGYAYGDTSQKYIYLTFDEGYEYGYTSSILDTLRENNVKAAFFVTEPYVTSSFKGVKNIDLVKRMGNEGHVIGNHSVHHKSMPSFTIESDFDTELTGVESAVDNIPGLKVSKFFRPPMGDFSELSLYYTQKLGYKTVFFSLAYYDYDVNNQPDPEKANNFLLQSTKPGMICLLHAESKTNAIILDKLIKEWKNEGYTFKTLDELP